MIRKFFPLDKNYLLKEAQAALQESLLTCLVEACKAEYEECHNPLRLADAFSLKVKNTAPRNLSTLDDLYQTVAGIYRFKFGETQLEFLWDGQDHLDKYKSEWSTVFDKWMGALLCRPQFVQAVLDVTIFLPENHALQLAENRMRFVIQEYFSKLEGFPSIKTRKGQVELRVA